MTDAEERDGYAAVLAEHRDWYQNGESATGKRWLCTCGELIDDDFTGYDIVRRWRAHVAAALVDSPHHHGVKAAAWESGHDECCAVYLRHCVSANNPHRAAAEGATP